MTVLLRLLNKEAPPAELRYSLAELQRLGLVGPDGQLLPLLHELLGALAHPAVSIQADVTGPQGTLRHGLLVGEDSVISYDEWPGEGESEYGPIDITTLVDEMARKVRLRRSPAETETLEVTEIRTTTGILDTLLTALNTAPHDLPSAKEALLTDVQRGTHDEDRELAALVTILLSLDAAWRMTATWDSEQGAESTRSMAVWDCGRHGYWLRTDAHEPHEEGEPDPNSPLTLIRSDATRIRGGLADLLPKKRRIPERGE
ncbi:hypothetical protein [Streptomyces sp. NPDC003717]|uniref:hypothetical protein n=1 Tax=Streptomyces sp. NPDC003717 TaxID=3154276 RepID=UPI0033A50D83